MKDVVTKREDLALQMGLDILDTFDRYIEEGKLVGVKLVLPQNRMRTRMKKEYKIIYPSFSDWIFTVEITRPNLFMKTGPLSYRSLSPGEFFKIAGKMELDK